MTFYILFTQNVESERQSGRSRLSVLPQVTSPQLFDGFQLNFVLGGLN
jgi:hypothetical protein